jgi:hypothetical protein
LPIGGDKAGPGGRMRDRGAKTVTGGYDYEQKRGKGLGRELGDLVKQVKPVDGEPHSLNGIKPPGSASGLAKPPAPIRHNPTLAKPTPTPTRPPATPVPAPDLALTAKPVAGKKLQAELGEAEEGQADEGKAKDGRGSARGVFFVLRKTLRSAGRPLTGWLDGKPQKAAEVQQTHAANQPADTTVQTTTSLAAGPTTRQSQSQFDGQLGADAAQTAVKQRQRLTRLYITVNLKREANVAANQTGEAANKADVQQNKPAKGE